jgi:hypothetical protein
MVKLLLVVQEIHQTPQCCLFSMPAAAIRDGVVTVCNNMNG